MSKQMVLRFLVFLIVTSVIIFLLHLYLYKSHIKFLDIQSIVQKRIIIGIYTGMFVLLFFSMFAVRIWTSKFVDILYFISTLWLGILTCLVIFSVLNLGFFGVFKLLNINVNLKYLHLIFLGLVLIFSVYGVVNYYSVKEKIVEIKIKNLPDKWVTKRVFMISDIHIGSFRDEKFIGRWVEILNSKNADIIIICGDLFDGTKIDVAKISDALSKLRANEKVYFVFGNHDLYTKTEDVYAVLQNAGFYVLDNASINHDEVDIVGINHRSLHDKAVFSALKEDEKLRPKILLSHEPVRDIKTLEDFEIDLQLSGHTHGGQFFPFTLITKSMYGNMNYGLADFGKFKNFTSSGLAAWGPAFRLFTNSEIVQLKFVKE